MSLLRIWSLVRGYVVISVEGKHIERFINMAVSQGFILQDIFQPRDNLMIAKVNLSVYPRLRHIARASKCKLRIRKKKGLPFLLVRMRSRKMLVAGAIVFFISLYLLSSFIWIVEVTSSKELKLVTKEEIFKAAAELGLKRGIPGFLVDNRSVAEALEREFIAEISWVGVEQHGTKVIIEVAEKVLPEQDPERGHPGNIVAQKDGVIKEILVLSGEAKVAAGDTVKKGDILISGILYPQEGDKPGSSGEAGEGDEEQQPAEPTLVSARGLVRARVWYEAQARVPLLQHRQLLTGHRQKVVVLKIGEKKIFLKEQKGEKYKHYRTKEDTRRLVLWQQEFPVALITTTYSQLEKEDVYYSMAEAKAIAEKAAMKDISSKLPENVDLVSRKVHVSSFDEQEINAVVYVETVENIGHFVSLD